MSSDKLDRLEFMIENRLEGWKQNEEWLRDEADTFEEAVFELEHIIDLVQEVKKD